MSKLDTPAGLVRALLVSGEDAQGQHIEDLFDSAGEGQVVFSRSPGDAPEAIDATAGFDVCLVTDSPDSPAVSRLLASASEGAPPVILLTGTPDSAAVQSAIRAGAVDALPLDEINWMLLERAMRYAIAHREATEKLRSLSLRDPVTGLIGQTLFWEMLDHSLARTRRDRASLAVFSIYISGIGKVNEASGRSVGDTVLRHVAARLRLVLRASDCLARFSGTRMVAILESMTAPADVMIVVEKILAAIAEPILIRDDCFTLEGRIGIAVFPTTASRAEGLIRSASEAMDAAMESGEEPYRLA